MGRGAVRQSDLPGIATTPRMDGRMVRACPVSVYEDGSLEKSGQCHRSKCTFRFPCRVNRHILEREITKTDRFGDRIRSNGGGLRQSEMRVRYKPGLSFVLISAFPWFDGGVQS